MSRRSGTLVFALSLLLAILLTLVRFPDVLVAIKPYWLALVLVYWVLETPERVPLGFAFLLGLSADLLSGVLLGEQALRLVVLVFIVTRFRPRLRFFPMWQQTLAVLALLLNDRILLLMVRAFAGESMPPVTYWVAPFVGAALWPFVFLLLDDVRARVRAHE